MNEKDEARLAAESTALLLGAVPCPSCAGFPGECCRCHGEVGALYRAPVPDPVEALRAGRDEVDGPLHLFCAGCVKDLANDLGVLLADGRSRGPTLVEALVVGAAVWAVGHGALVGLP